MRFKNFERGLLPDCPQSILQVESHIGLSRCFEAVPLARDAQKHVFDGNKMKTWPDLITQMRTELGFQGTGSGYDFVGAAFVDCMRDAVDEAEDGLILTFANAGRILSRDKMYSFDDWQGQLGDVARYARAPLDDGEWWDRGPRYFRVILANPPGSGRGR